jgi:hypothetical protein
LFLFSHLSIRLNIFYGLKCAFFAESERYFSSSLIFSANKQTFPKMSSHQQDADVSSSNDKDNLARVDEAIEETERHPALEIGHDGGNGLDEEVKRAKLKLIHCQVEEEKFGFYKNEF